MKSISVKVGDKVAEGTVVLEVEAAGRRRPPRPPPRPLLLRRPRPLKLPSLPLLPRRLRLPAPVPSRSRCRTSATSSEVEVIEVMVAVGDTIKAEQSLITVESDKASMEIPTRRAAGEVKVKVGDKVAKGSVVVVVEGSAPAAAAPAQAAAAAPAPRPRRRHRRLPPPPRASGRRAGRRQPEAGPAAARFALGARSRASWA